VATSPPGIEEAVVAHVGRDRAAALALLGDLVAAARRGEAAMQAIVDAAFREIGYATDVFEADLAALAGHPEYSLMPELATLGTAGRPNVVARLEGAAGGRSLFAFAHVDSYVLDPTGWRFDPYAATATEDGRVVGYGIADDRSGVAGMILAARALAAVGVRPAGTVTMASCLGKHLGAGGTLAVIARGYGGDGAVYLHPAETGAGLAEFKAFTLGLVQFRVTVGGRDPRFRERYQTPAAHRGASAIERAALLIGGLRAWDDERAARLRHPAIEAVLGRSTNLNVGRIEGGQADHEVPLRCSFTGTITFPPGETVASVRAAFEEAVRGLGATLPDPAAPPPVVEWLPLMANPAGGAVDGPFVRSFVGCLERVTGATPAVWPAHTASDIRYPLLYADAPTVGFGPRAGRFGGPDEWLDVEDFLRMVQALALLIVRWCGTAPAPTGQETER
jgi:acetylornithine deacetylase